ncbi:hypothetical protein V8C26DRAFT_390322 [Trichoderma gracile]
MRTVAEANEEEVPCDEDTRRALWEEWVFAGGWDTDCTVDAPGEIRPRSAREVNTLVGTIKPGMPRSADATRQGKPTPAQRQPGQPVFLKPNINWDDYGLTFIWCDSKGRAVNSRWVQLTESYSAAQARADAVVTWDTAETRRVTQYNHEWLAFWARCRLIHWMRDNPAEDGTGSLPSQQSRDVPRQERHDVLVKLRTCQSILDDLVALSLETRTIQGGRVGGRVSLKKA